MADVPTQADESDIPVTAETPDSPVGASGVDHITLIGSNEEDTVEYYRDILGMPLVLRQPNLDNPDATHLFFDAGDGRIITFFVTDDRDSDNRPQRVGMGGVHHLAFSVDGERLPEIAQGLEDHGYGYNEFDRGAFHSLYTRDHNGLTIELAADKFEIPDDRRGEVLAHAQAHRVDSGAEYVKDEHMRAALEELGIPVEEIEIPSTAASGSGGL
ncbi:MULTISPECIES: VOC family protein [Halolamina]|uniref:Catechol 2,3-dioxygenase n=1 Tax=Halolamina pelagica TaxID=699431 RepID=A0A1I5NQI5_9EURY|nr:MULTISPECIES: VOC family protein [Halolamina]NHX36431.1 VOC family protein [Halolamina sp. R1-12]SFP24063.1 Catechol 2,3-dioxygenase [Halolamina pelagica]